MKTNYTTITTIGLAALVFVSVASAQTQNLFFDDFNSGVTGWTTNTPTSTFVATTTAGPIAASPAARYSANGGTGDGRFAASAAIAPVTLHAGESISLSFDYKGITYTENNGNWLIFGLSDSGNTPERGDDKGYLSAIGTDARTTGQPARARYNSYATGIDPATANVNGGAVTATRTGTIFQLNGAPVSAGEPPVPATGNIEDSFHFAFVITREANGDLSLLTTFTNVTQSTESVPVSFTSTAIIAADDIQTYQFDTLNIGCIRRSGGVFAVDNVSVDYQAILVPEPATIASLLGLGALLICAIARQRR